MCTDTQQAAQSCALRKKISHRILDFCIFCNILPCFEIRYNTTLQIFTAIFRSVFTAINFVREYSNLTILRKKDVTRNVAAIAITLDLTAISDDGVGKFLHIRLLDIRRYPHFQKAGFASLLQRQRHENLRLFFALAPLFPCY
jgi:hypothetical protein